jgi:hypothetical protein
MLKVFFVTTFELKKLAMEDSTRRAKASKRLHMKQRVSGSVGEYIEGSTKRRRHQRLYGNIISAIGEWKYMVRFDDGSEKECSSMHSLVWRRCTQMYLQTSKCPQKLL